MARKDHSNTDCTIVAILTHGINGRLYSTDGDLIPVDDITKYFDGINCPSLIGKPKVLSNYKFEQVLACSTSMCTCWQELQTLNIGSAVVRLKQSLSLVSLHLQHLSLTYHE